MKNRDWIVANGAESLIGLFGHDAPENAALDIVDGYIGIGEASDDERQWLAEAVWERYNNLVEIEERLGCSANGTAHTV